MYVSLKSQEIKVNKLIVSQLRRKKAMQRCNTYLIILLIINALNNQYHDISMYRWWHKDVLHQSKFIYLTYRHLQMIMYHLCISTSGCKHLIINDIDYTKRALSDTQTN